MDGIQTRLKYSLQWRATVILSLLITVVALIGGAFAFETAFKEAQDWQDAQLQQIARLLDPNSSALKENHQGDINFPETASRLPKPRVLAQSMDSPNINSLFEDDAAARNLQRMRDGFHNFTTATHHWRLYIYTVNHHRLVVAQRAVYRNRIATDSAKSTVWPLVLLLPVLWLLIALFVRYMFRVTQKLSEQVARRSDLDLSAIDCTDVPLEIQPFVLTLNRLFEQLCKAMEHDKQFIAHAAHELRTPITALTLQMARLNEPRLSQSEQQKLLQDVQRGVRRTQELLTQLLSMARAQHPHDPSDENTSTILKPLLRELFAEILPLADAKHHDLSVNMPKDYRINMRQNDVYTVLNNLLTNAIRYTPAHGRIQVTGSISTSKTLVIWVSDTGCGIGEPEKRHIFEPFYRVPGSSETGSGLGLAIVQALCRQWQIDIIVRDSLLPHTGGTRGLSIGLCFPEHRYHIADNNQKDSRHESD